MLPSPNPIDNVVNVIAEVVVGGLDGRGQETHTDLHEGTLATPQVTDIGQQQGKFNNISGDRLSKKKREAIKKRLQQSIGKDTTRIDTGQQTEGYADAQVTEGNMAKMPPDDYGALNSEDDLDPDNQSLEDSDNEAADTQPHTSQVFGSSFKDKVTDVQRMTEQ
ncbi:hypothetical protein KY289_005478 [Solanum tuberosum]|nr:hypothetical protein KY289_005478 [Solanum tuberosum]